MKNSKEEIFRQFYCKVREDLVFLKHDLDIFEEQFCTYSHLKPLHPDIRREFVNRNANIERK